jgi:hypothetical protein
LTVLGPRSRAAIVALAVGLLCAVAAPLARAGQLDEDLLKKGGHVLLYLNDKGYRNVGVLPFQVKKGYRPASFEGAPVAMNLTTRLENTLILSQDPAGKTLGIIRNAAGSASRAQVGAYRTNPVAFRKLFVQDYPLAWGNRKVKADVFLTGTVINSGKDRSRTTVVIEAFDAKSMKAGKLLKEKVCELTFPTDRAMLSDLGYAWSLSPTVLRRGFSAGQRDQVALRQVTRRDEQGDNSPRPDESQANTPVNIAGFSFEIYYNNAKQPITPLSEGQPGSKAPLYQVPPAPPGADIVMVLTRQDESQKMLGAVLKVNGKSTWQLEDGENIQCRKWLYGPDRKGQPDRFLGFYMDTEGRNLRKFKVLTPEESADRARELGNRVGWIDIEVFASGAGGAPGDSTKMISTRSLAARQVAPGSGLREVQRALRKANNVRMKPVKLPLQPRLVVSRDVIDAEVEPIESGAITTGELPNPQSLGSISIRYRATQQGGETIGERQ